MPFERDTLPELIDQGAAQFESRLPGVLARVRNSVIGVINRVLAGGLDALGKYMEWLSLQFWVDTCDAIFLPLHGAIWGVPQLQAEQASGVATFTGINTSAVPQGTVVKRLDGVLFVTTAPGVIAGGSADVPVEAVEPGQLGNTLIDVQFNITTAVPGVDAVVTANTAIAGGADIEQPEPWRARILLRIRKPPQGGADYDYVTWAKEVPGVTRAWPYPGEQGPGTVVVRFVRDDDASPIPDAGEVAAVQAYIDARRPTTATTYVVAPIDTPQAFTIHLDPDTPAIRGAVNAELKALYRREAKPGGTMLITHQREAISTAPGENDHVLSVPAANQTHTAGQMPSMGVITWV